MISIDAWRARWINALESNDANRLRLRLIASYATPYSRPEILVPSSTSSSIGPVSGVRRLLLRRAAEGRRRPDLAGSPSHRKQRRRRGQGLVTIRRRAPRPRAATRHRSTIAHSLAIHDRRRRATVELHLARRGG